MSQAPTLEVRPVPVAALQPAQVETMWQLYADAYDHVDRETFHRDLAEKSLVFLGTDARTGGIVGFSTAAYYRHQCGGRTVGVYFSGDTIIQRPYWGQTALHRAVVMEMVRWRLRHPLTPLYWFLICSGYRTYLTLVRNFPTHWPHHERATPAWERGLIASLARARYPGAWRESEGVVSFGGAQPVLKTSVASITPDLLALPEIRFFVQANPGHARGDELAMIARLDAAALWSMSAKWIRKACRARHRHETLSRPAWSSGPGATR